MLDFAPHPLLHPAAFTTDFGSPLADRETPSAWLELHRGEGAVPKELRLSEEAREVLRQDVRDLLRHGGHKPTGRGKPSSEYLVRASGEGKIPTINLAVDACNAVSLATGLPISVVDFDRATPPFRVDVAESGAYVFNASGQEIRLDGLLCLHGPAGPIANAVKDSHATKTSPSTVRTLSIVWAPAGHAAFADRALAWYRSLLEDGCGARTERVP